MDFNQIIKDILTGGLDPAMAKQLKEIAGAAHAEAMRKDKMYRGFVEHIIKESVKEFMQNKDNIMHEMPKEPEKQKNPY